MQHLKTVNKTLHINADIGIVWQTLTTPVLMRQWMSDKEINIISDWKKGGSFSITGKMEDVDYASKGYILEFEHNCIFKYSYWNAISKVPDVPENYQLVEFKLLPNNTQTTVVFTQSNFVGEATFEHANFYWNVALEVMKRFIENGWIL